MRIDPAPCPVCGSEVLEVLDGSRMTSCHVAGPCGHDVRVTVWLGEGVDLDPVLEFDPPELAPA